ncbi:MAG: hypothetical protein NWE83_02540 [Candidatus Bathyarchaeota archaeon]|nr:hypothetical protein [Candidatus Bathyarchaeota archaeon]
MSLLNWRGWLLGVFLGGLTTIHFLVTILGIVLILLVPERLAVSGYWVTRRQIWLWRENDIGIMFAALGCSFLIFFLRS